MKKIFLIFLFLVPSFLFATGRKDKVYEYLTGIEGMGVEILSNKPYYCDSSFNKDFYEQFGPETYGNVYNPTYKEFLKDERVIALINQLGSNLSRQFIIWNDGFYMQSEHDVRRYSLDTGEIEETFDCSYYDVYFSRKAGLCIGKYKNSTIFEVIELSTMSLVNYIYTDGEFVKTYGLDFLNDFSKNQAIFFYNQKLCLINYFTGEIKELIDLSPLIPQKRDLRVFYWYLQTLENGHIQFIFQYHDNYYLCEYTVPEEYLITSSE